MDERLASTITHPAAHVSDPFDPVPCTRRTIPWMFDVPSGQVRAASITEAGSSNGGSVSLGDIGYKVSC